VDAAHDLVPPDVASAFEDAGITQSAKNGISMSHQIHFWFDSYVSTSNRGVDALGRCSCDAGARGELGERVFRGVQGWME